MTDQPTNGILSGTVPDLTYTPNTDFHGNDSFTFVANDGMADSPPATVALIIDPVNDPPEGIDQTVSTQEDSSVEIVLAGTDVDGDPLTFSLETPPAEGTITGAPPVITYTPNPDVNGTDSLTFTVSDGNEDSVAPATVTITIDPVNDAPMATGQSVTAVEDTPVAITLAGTDIDGDSLSFAIGDPPQNGSLAGTPPDITYTPNADFHGNDNFTFTTNDGTEDSTPASIAINVQPVNDDPVADDQSVNTPEDTPLSILLTGSDADNDSLSFTILTPPDAGTLSETAPNLTYTPNEHFNGNDSLTFTVNDGTTDSPPATITITVDAVNDPPVGVPQNVALTEDTSVDITLSATDVEDDALTFTISTPPANGNLAGTPPDLTYTPNPDIHGPDSFTFTANDGTDDSLPVTVTINISAVNDIPVADNQSGETAEDTPVALTLTATDVDGDDVTFQIATPPAEGTLSGTSPDVSYIPNPDFNGTDTFMFTANDGNDDSLPATVTITVTPVNDPPEANDLAVTTSEDTPDVSIVLTAADPEDDPLTFTIVDPPQFGTLTNSLSPPTSTLAEIPPEVFYTPNPDFNGTDVFTYIANDDTRNSAVATVNITVQPVNDPPVADNQTISIPEDSPAAITLTATDIDDDPLTFVVVTPPQNGVLNGTAPDLAYTPDPHFNGNDTLVFTVNDGELDADNATVTITVDSINDAPTITSTPVTSVDVDQAYAYDVEADDPDSAADLTFSLDTAPTGMDIEAASGLISWTPDAPQLGDHNVIVRVQDADGLFDAQEFTITVVDTIPTITIDAPADGLVTFQSFVDVSGSTSNAVSVTVNGIAATLSGDAFATDAVPLVEGSNTITATVENASGSTTTTTITVVRDPDLPVISVLSPGENAVIPEFTVTVQGTVVDDSLSVLTINGNVVPVVNEGFLHTVSLLNEGNNLITLTATDSADNTSPLN